MKIKETIERECCTRDDDFIKIKNNPTSQKRKRKVCKYCGKLWEQRWQCDSCDPDGGGYVWEQET